MVWVMGLSTIRLRWVGGLGCDRNNLSGHISPCLDMTALHDKDSDVDPGPMSTTPGPAVSLGPAGPSMRKGETIEFTTKSISYSYKGRILNYLSGIDLSFNKLTSEIPYQVGNLTGIHSLNLSHNELSGPIPLSFSYLRQIESLDLSYNYLNGKIPTQLVELYNLAVFSVAHNNLTDIFYLRQHLVSSRAMPLGEFSCDIVTTTTHKKDPALGVDLESAINNAVFPGLQGDLHNHTIGSLAVCLKHAQSPEFKNYQDKVVSNCGVLASRVIELGYKLVSGSSD
ncbi:hypothetical protein LWI28_001738 [Acer negundo]|uniref:Serine hydroxymethyltransferase-like domain-containing protein n=1 Tax=Acer negundo TaxID=4023 RepID=A0AAD5J809_ACENE|nr:hypothetical protein LWI28_001738 [Acer negundo]